MDLTLQDWAAWATIVALAAAVVIFLFDFWWRRVLRAKDLLRDLTGPGSETMIREVHAARVALGIDHAAVTGWSREARIERWRVILGEVRALKEAGDTQGDKIANVNVIIVFHNRLEEIADGYLSGFASRKIVKTALDRWLAEYAKAYEGFYLWFIEENRKLSPPKDHGYRSIQRLVDRVAVAPSA